METKGFMPINLQLFGGMAEAEGAAPEAETERAKGSGTAGASKGRGEAPEGPEAPGGPGPEKESSQKERAESSSPPDLNALLAGDRGLQSQFDKLVSKALTTAQARWEREKNMTAEQLAEVKAEERAQELAQRERTLHAKELRVEAIEQLGERGVPTELIDCVSLADAETMRASVAKAEQAFRAAVERAVRERMTGTAPKSGRDSAAAYMAQFRAAAGIRTK